MDFAEIIRNSARTHSGDVAVWFERRTQTYAGMYDRACRLASGLGELGVRPGDRVAVLGDNGYETVEQIAALALANVTRATLYSYYSAETNAYLLNLIEATVLIADHDHYRLVEPLLGRVPSLKHVLVVGDSSVEGTVGYDDLIAASAPTDPDVAVHPDDVHLIRFSSGTTGKPKGIFHTVEKWLGYNAEYRWVTPTMDERDRYLSPGSLSHLGIAFVWSALAVGARLVPMAKFDAATVLDVIEKERITYATMVPTMIASVVELPDASVRDLSSLRCLMYAGSPISDRTLRKAVDVFGESLYQLYAQSEVAPVTMLRAHEHVVDGNPVQQRRLHSAGRPTPYVTLSIVDDDGNPVPAGEIGEIAALSPGGMSGIWNDPEGTAARLLADGSIRTRDMGYLDEDGYLHIADRKDDMIISGGYNIWPTEIEDALREHSAVADVCVIGVPDERWGETPKAFVVLREELDRPSADELIEFVAARVGRIKKPTSIDFEIDLPRSAAGKVQHAVLRRRYWTHNTRIAGS